MFENISVASLFVVSEVVMTLEENKKWFKEAKFGMMVHFGLYSVLGGEYKDFRSGYDDTSTANAEWIRSKAKIPKDEYVKLTKVFNPIFFDAEEWVKLAKDAGMQYIVVTSKHHEGFCLFKSDVDDFNVVDATPFGRDIIAELAEACRKHDMKLGLYYSQELDWNEPDSGGYLLNEPERYIDWANTWDYPDNSKKDFSKYFYKKAIPQVKEILTKYGDLCLIWFDTPVMIPPEYSDELYNLVRELQPHCLVNTRIGNGRGDYKSMGDNEIPDKYMNDILAETPATLNSSWGWKYFDENFKSADEVMRLKEHLNSRGVNYLLNVGPDHLGRIPKSSADILREVGRRSK